MPDNTENMTKQQAAYYAAIFAVTNMGRPIPEFRTLKQMRSGPTISITPTSMIYIAAQQYMESEEIEVVFCNEAESWYKRFITEPLQYIADRWPDTANFWKYPDAPIIGELGTYQSHSAGQREKQFKVTGFMKDHPEICLCDYLTTRQTHDPAKPVIERLSSSFIWTFNNAGNLTPRNYKRQIEYNMFHVWERKPV